VAVSADGAHWFLINASPDLRLQIESFAPLQPRAVRGSPIAGVLVTNADLDHTLGLFLLRGGGGLRIFADAEIWATLRAGLKMEDVLTPYGGVSFTPAPSALAPLTLADGSPSGLAYRAIPLPGNAPRYAPGARDERQSFAFEIADERTGAHLLIAPDVAAITPALLAAMSSTSMILFDGTFWTDDELQCIDPGARTASQMGHLPIRTGSLPILRSFAGARRIYLHINNTNPILARESAERMEVENAGIAVGEDGMEFEL
jgi:pyrroloquinoline quinone biosynthesis protein B